jgi:hypothetical protein
VGKSRDNDQTLVELPPEGGGRPPVRGGWDLAGQVIDQMASGNWTWSNTWQLAVLVMVLAVALAILALAGHDLAAWTTAGVGGGALVGMAYRHRKPPRK